MNYAKDSPYKTVWLNWELAGLWLEFLREKQSRQATEKEQLQLLQRPSKSNRRSKPPLQLPANVSTKFSSGEQVHGVLLWIDNERGNRYWINPSTGRQTLSHAIVLLQSGEHQGKLFHTPSGAATTIKNNCSDGWLALKTESGKALVDFKVENGGPGFRNCSKAGYADRDLLLYKCTDMKFTSEKAAKATFVDLAVAKQMATTVTLAEVLTFFGVTAHANKKE